MKPIAFEEFAQGASLMHSLDARVKVVSAVAFACIVAVSSSFAALIVALLVAVGMVNLAQLSWWGILRRLAVVNAFVLLLWLVLPFTYPGEPLLTIGPATASTEGVIYALTITFRTNAIVMATIALTGTLPAFALLNALCALRVPTKLVNVFYFCYRYISVINREYRRLYNAMRVRCFRPNTSLHTYKTYAYLIGMLLIRSFERSERIYQAMLCRGFQGKFPAYYQFCLRKRELLCIALMALLVGALVLLESHS